MSRKASPRPKKPQPAVRAAAAPPATFDAMRRLVWLKWTIVLGLLAGLLLSHKLWMGDRLYPYAPPLPGMPALSKALEAAAFVALVGLLAAVLFVARPRRLIFAALALAALLAAFDQMRWQAWFYQYCFMLAALGLFSWKQDDADGGRTALNTCRLIVASLYFYSGLQKLNPVFTAAAFPWMIEPVAKYLPAAVRPALASLGVAVPFLEMAIGVGLLASYVRKFAIALALAMLAFVLLTLGPWGHNEDSIVWPWNLAMAAFVLILFWRVEPLAARDVFWKKGRPFHFLVFVLFGLLPILSFANLWDSYLSASLFSGNTNFARIEISDTVRNKLPAEVQRFAVANGRNRYDVKFFPWAFGELNVPPYPESRVFKAIARYFCQYAERPNDVTLSIVGKQTVFNRDLPSSCDCAELGGAGEALKAQ